MRYQHVADVSKLVVTIVVLGFFIRIGPLKAQPVPPPVPSPDKTAVQVYKNIQVLKTVPSDQLVPAMQFITSSLGVQCDFCHMQGAFDKDDKKPKVVARKMMQMMMIINQENFDSHREVTCATCHRGSPTPVAIPIISAEATPPLPPGLDDEEKSGANLPSADQIVDKYVKAVGGTQAIDKLKTRVAHGQIIFGPRKFPVDIFNESSGKYAVITHLPNGDNFSIYDGHEGWTSAPGHGLRNMSSPEIASASLDADLHFPVDQKKVFRELRVEREEKLGDRPAYVIVGAREGLPPTRLYFDEQTGLLVREIRYAESPLGLNPTQIDYSDYRDQDGVKVPFHWTSSQPYGRSSIQIEKIDQNVSIDESKFAKPPAPATQERQ